MLREHESSNKGARVLVTPAQRRTWVSQQYKGLLRESGEANAGAGSGNTSKQGWKRQAGRGKGAKGLTARFLSPRMKVPNSAPPVTVQMKALEPPGSLLTI